MNSCRTTGRPFLGFPGFPLGLRGNCCPRYNCFPQLQQNSIGLPVYFLLTDPCRYEVVPHLHAHHFLGPSNSPMHFHLGLCGCSLTDIMS